MAMVAYTLVKAIRPGAGPGPLGPRLISGRRKLRFGPPAPPFRACASGAIFSVASLAGGDADTHDRGTPAGGTAPGTVPGSAIPGVLLVALPCRSSTAAAEATRQPGAGD